MNVRDHALPIPAGADVDNFRIYSAPEVIGLMREMIMRRALLTVHFNEGRESIVTILLSVNPEFEEVVFDRGADGSSNDHLLHASKLTFVTSLDHIKIQFQCPRAYDTTFDGKPAFRMRIPSSVLRLQRRNTYRVKLPQAHPVLCRIPRAGAAEPVKLRVLDLSVEGVALVAEHGQIELHEGDKVKGCRIDLPDHPLQVDLEVRNALEILDPSGHRWRYGCRFVNLPGAMAALVQRVILSIERAQHR